MHGIHRTALKALLGCMGVVGLVGCSNLTLASGLSSAPEGKTITAEQIRRSGARNGWEALQRNGTHLSMRENYRGDPSRLNYRGQV